ncbi:hypothetical protein ACKWTF_002126 [Chironomus riparius]
MKKASKQNQIKNLSEEKGNENDTTTKIEVDPEIVIKILESSKDENLLVELPVEDHNSLTECESIKPEEFVEEAQLKTLVIQKKKEMDSEEFVQNAELKRIKADQSDIKRRRSLRNETAASIKKKPPKYEEIFSCYKRKEYKECIIYIDLVAESAKDWIEYQILKAACLIHLGIKLTEAHKILDDILKINNKNSFSFYAKGLAYYREEQWLDSIEYFEKAIALDKSSMQRAEVMLKLAKEELEKMSKDDVCLLSNEIKTEPIEEQDDPDFYEYSQSDMNDPIPNVDKKNRFKCEICNKCFCKKFNLDRHNKIMHNRETPFIPPLPRNYNSRRSAPEPLMIKVEEKSLSPISPVVSKSSQFKIKLGKKKIKRTQSMSEITDRVKSEMGRCKICKKLYRKGSLARHEIIHSGVKQFTCEDCPMAFYQKSDLQRHITIHSNVFDYECELCEKKFRIKKNLQVHNKRHHSK